jgi:hypothetical protein
VAALYLFEVAVRPAYQPSDLGEAGLTQQIGDTARRPSLRDQ